MRAVLLLLLVLSGMAAVVSPAAGQAPAGALGD